MKVGVWLVQQHTTVARLRSAWRQMEELNVNSIWLWADGRLMAWFDGGSEFGPRALGHRSILCALFPASVRDHLNEQVKFREWFRPYAPIVPVERASEFFDISQPSPYMLMRLVRHR